MINDFTDAEKRFLEAGGISIESYREGYAEGYARGHAECNAEELEKRHELMTVIVGLRDALKKMTEYCPDKN